MRNRKTRIIYIFVVLLFALTTLYLGRLEAEFSELILGFLVGVYGGVMYGKKMW